MVMGIRVSEAEEYEGVDIAEWLMERYPSEMTVVMQHWYDGLDITDDGFAITLNFGDAPEPLYIPFDSIQTFVDPSVEFGLRFESQSDGEEPIEEAPQEIEDIAEVEADPEDNGDADVVSLDSFRKR